MDSTTTLLITVFLLAALVGAASQRTQFCLVGGVREWLFEQRNVRFAAFVCAIGVAIMASALIEWLGLVNLNETRPPYRQDTLSWGRYLIGGFLFGMGMALSRGCGMRNLIKLAQGNLISLPVLFIMALTAYAMTRTDLYQQAFVPWITPLSLQLSQWGMSHQDLGSLLSDANAGEIRLLMALLMGSGLLLWANRLAPARQHVGHWLGGVIVGGAVAAFYVLSGGTLGQGALEEAAFQSPPQEGLGTQSMTFSAPLGDLLYYLMQPSQIHVLTLGATIMLGVFAGAGVHALSSGQFKLIPPSSQVSEWGRLALGALLVGIGSVLAMGCSVGQGISGVATLSLGSFMALASIMAGAYTVLKWDVVRQGRS